MIENKSVTINAPAKINLTLNVGKKRHDGYHEVKMIMQAVDLCDAITVEFNNSGVISIECNNKNVPTDETNLVYKAAIAFYSELGCDIKGTHIKIEKNIPMQAGLAGGSTDCAAALLALNILHDDKLSATRLKEIGAKLGADVPFCFEGSTMLATGTGTTLEKIHDMPQCHIVLVKPNLGVSTKEAYEKIDSRENLSDDASDIMIKAFKDNDIVAVSNILYNDFQDVLNIDEVNLIRNELISNGALGACMSGSGPTVFGLFDDMDKANNAYNRMKNSYDEVYIAKPICYGCK